MAIMQSCCCWRSLRKGCYASSIYTMMYFAITIVTMGHFLDNEQRYLSGAMSEPESESFLEPEKITPITVALNITLLVSSTIGMFSCFLLIIGIYKDIKLLLLPWIAAMAVETLVEIINLIYLFYLQTMNFNPITSFLFTLDFFIIFLNVYSMMCVISQYQEYCAGRGTADYDLSDRMASVQYTATAQHTTTTSSAPSGRRRSGAKAVICRADVEEASEVPTKSTISSAMSRATRSTVKKHVQFPDESCIEEAPELPETEEERQERPVDSRIISSLWMELETETAVPER